MNNIWTIFKNDLRHLGINAISWVVVVGLIVIPSLYAWFCIYAFWDPYKNTEHLKVAVASIDEGYESSLLPMRLNLGKEVLEQLRDNHQLEWHFVGRKEAIEGVKSGKYYAALIIPKDFSQNLLSILSDDVQSAEILYYINEKENAIAAKVSSQGASTIQNAIDEVVAETASGILLNSLETVSGIMNDQNAEELSVHLRQKLQSLSDELDSSADMMESLCNINTSLNSLLKATDELLTEAGSNTEASVRDLESMDLSFDTLENDLNTMNDKMDTVFQNTEQAYNAVNDSATQYLQNMDRDADTISASLNTLADRVQTIAGRYEDLQDHVQDLADSLPPELTVSQTLLNEISISLDRSIRQQMQIHDSLINASEDLKAVSSDALQYQGELSGYIRRCNQDLQSLRERYHSKVQTEIITLTDSLDETKKSVKAVMDGLGSTASVMKNTAGSASSGMEQMDQTLASTADLLRDASGKLRGILQQVDQQNETGTLDIVKKLMGNNSEAVSSYVSSVVKLDSHIIYPVANFGAAMAPFYTSLAIWVGAVILVAMLKVTLSDKMLALLKNVKNWQTYLGRFGIFLLLSLLQCLLIAMGDLYFLGIQCVHSGLFVLTCLYIGFVFVTLIYTLAASFGNIGKALAVILLVFQVAGSGGTIPIEMTPSFFHVFYPLLPLTHSMAALRECVAGMYGDNYCVELGILSIYIWISLILGLVLRNPMINLNRAMVEKMENTKIM